MKHHFDDISIEWIGKFKECSIPGLLFSPYITKSPFVDYLISCNVKHVIYTNFCLASFANGASDISTLEKLLLNGHDIYHIPSLHAKLVIIPQKYASIGSQNITRKGKENKEANISIFNEKNIDEIENLIKPWIEQRQAITTLMIEKASNEIQAYKKDIETTKNKLNKLTLKILEHIPENKFNSFENTLQKSTLSNAGLIAKIKFIDENHSKTRLVWTKKQPLTEWSVEGNNIQLIDKFRYLFIIGNKVGWARVNKTQISFIGSEIDNLDTIKICNETYNVSVATHWSSDVQSNLVIKLTGSSKHDKITLRTSFSIDKLNINSYTISDKRNIEKISLFLEKNKNNIEREINTKLIRPFKYEKNLYGKSADKFFDKAGSSFMIKLAKLGDELFLVGNPI